MDLQQKGTRSEKSEDSSKGQGIRDAVLFSAPTILIVYPLVGFGLGYLGYRLWHWPQWISIVTLLMGFVQGIREVVSLGKKLEKPK
jgi:F0F1-type ATP synthase assembly protein I